MRVTANSRARVSCRSSSTATGRSARACASSTRTQRPPRRTPRRTSTKATSSKRRPASGGGRPPALLFREGDQRGGERGERALRCEIWSFTSGLQSCCDGRMATWTAAIRKMGSLGGVGDWWGRPNLQLRSGSIIARATARAARWWFWGLDGAVHATPTVAAAVKCRATAVNYDVKYHVNCVVRVPRITYIRRT